MIERDDGCVGDTDGPAGGPAGGPTGAGETQLLLFPSAFELEPEGLRAWIERGVGARISLTLTRNRTSVLTFKRARDGSYDVRLQRAFLDAPDDVLNAVVNFVRRPTRPARERVVAYFASLDGSDRASARVGPPPELEPRGAVFDLGEVLAALNVRHFGGTVRSSITWGEPGRALGAGSLRKDRLRSVPGRRSPPGNPLAARLGPEPRSEVEQSCSTSEVVAADPRPGGGRTIRFGSYRTEHDLIRIHPTLDADWVPRYFLEAIVYHEMLHAVIPIARDDHGRRVIHPAEFRRREREFPSHAEAALWERENLRRLIEARG